MMKRAVVIVTFSLFVWTSEASAASILYFNDYNVGTDRMAEALVAVSGTHSVTTVTSLGDFTTQIASGSYQLGILFQQLSSGPSYDTAWVALASFITSGGSAIGADWSGNTSHSAAFGATFTDTGNGGAFTVTDASLVAGLVNPVDLTNPGWGMYSRGLSGSSAAEFAVDEAIVVGNLGRTLFNGFLSDTFADGPEGRQLYINEIGFVLDGDVQSVPEPASLLLLGTGILGLAKAHRRRKLTAKV